MVFIGYLVIAYLILLLKVVTYLPLGFVGRKQVLYQKQLEFTSDDKNMERELVPTADNDAVDNGKVASLDTNHHENI